MALTHEEKERNLYPLPYLLSRLRRKKFEIREVCNELMNIQDASKIMHMTEQFIRLGLRQQRLPIGIAVKTTDNRWTYDVQEHLIKEYLGEKKFKRRVQEVNHLLKGPIDVDDV